MTHAENSYEKARKKSLLGILLLAPHPLFGVTAIMGVLISTMSLKSTEGTPYHSHLKWQITTFWIGLAAYALGFAYWSAFGQIWIIVVSFGIIAYRLSININHWVNSLAPVSYTHLTLPTKA